MQCDCGPELSAFVGFGVATHAHSATARCLFSGPAGVQQMHVSRTGSSVLIWEFVVPVIICSFAEA